MDVFRNFSVLSRCWLVVMFHEGVAKLFRCGYFVVVGKETLMGGRSGISALGVHANL